MLSLFSKNRDEQTVDFSSLFHRLDKTEQLETSSANFSASAINWRLQIGLAVAAIIFAVFLWQAGDLQVNRGQAFSLESSYNRLEDTPLFGQRGAIFSADGEPLAWNEAASSSDFAQRKYATSSAFGHVLGYVNYPKKDSFGNFFRSDISGQAGLEAGFNSELSSAPGRKIYEIDATNDVMSESVVAPAQDGERLTTSLEKEPQEKIYELIATTAENRNFESGAAVIMDITTGELPVAVSYPGLASNELSSGNSEYLQALNQSSAAPFLNRVSEGRFTPGSIVKPFVALAALHENVITPQTTIVSRGTMRVENPYNPGSYTVFKDWKAHGPVTVRDALSVSSNIFFYQAGGGFGTQDGLGISKIASYSHAFGLGDKTGIQGFSEMAGVVPDPEWKEANFEDGTWRVGDTYNTAIGQYGYQVTPLAMARATAAIANDGFLPTPTLKNSQNSNLKPVGRNISKATYEVVKEGMRQAVVSPDGTARDLNLGFMDIASKTGTAELGGTDVGLNSWVIGFYPYENPQYAFAAVMANGPRGNNFGSENVMRNFFQWAHDAGSPVVGANQANSLANQE